MKLIDDRGRLFGKISVIDILVVIVVIVLAFAVYTRFFEKEQTAVAVDDDLFTYVLEVKGVRSLTAEALRVGDAIYDNDNDIYLGVIEDIRIGDSYQETAMTDGTYAYNPAENRYDVFLTIDSSGLVSGGRYYASRTYEISVNMSVSFYTKYCSTSAYVWSIDGVE